MLFSYLKFLVNISLLLSNYEWFIEVFEIAIT